MLDQILGGQVQTEDTGVTNARHYHALREVSTSLLSIKKGLDDNLTGDLLTPDIRRCLHYLGEITGEGRDWVGPFIVRGLYSVEDGKCHFHKRYVARHDVYYEGYAEEKGIWGTWELHSRDLYGVVRGGFHIWPEGMDDPSVPKLSEEADVPAPAEELVEASGP